MCNRISINNNKLLLDEEKSFIIDNVYCKRFFFDFSRPLVIVFGHAGFDAVLPKDALVNSPSPWGYEYIKNKKLNVIAFCSVNKACWYNSLKFQNYLRELSKKISVFSELLGYGGSMGGYGVSAFSNILGLSRVLLMNPFSTLKRSKVPFENRFNISKLGLIEGNFLDGSDMNAKGYVVYDPLNIQDRLHAKRYKNLLHLKVIGADHNTLGTLTSLKMMNYLFDNFVTDTIDSAFFESKVNENLDDKVISLIENNNILEDKIRMLTRYVTICHNQLKEINELKSKIFRLEQVIKRDVNS